MRQISVLVAAFLTVALAAGAWAEEGGAQGKNESKSRGGSTLDRQVVIETKFITVKATRARQFKFEWVVLGDGQSAVAADARSNVHRDDQDRVDLSFIPFVSQVVGTRYTAEDISPQTRVGSVWGIDNVLFVALDRKLINILSPPTIVVLNNKWAFTLESPALPVDGENGADLAALDGIPPIRDFVKTQVILPDAQTVLIGGLDTQQKVDAASRVPILSDIPGLGDLFLGSAHQRRENEKTQLLLFIKPIIVRTDD